MDSNKLREGVDVLYRIAKFTRERRFTSRAERNGYSEAMYVYDG